MSSNMYNLKSELRNENVILYDHENLNKLTISEGENLNRFSCKATLFFILNELDHDIICNYHIIGVGNVDLYDLSTRTIYQIEHSNSMDELQLIQNEPVQNYFCKNCEKKFNTRSIKHSPYPTTLILNALTYFNLGHTLQQTQATMQRKHKTKIPISTLNNWVSRFEPDLSFIRLKKNYNIDPTTAIHTKKFHHQQVYEFKYHTLKTNFSKRFFPELKSYITSITKIPYFIPESAFKACPRCSQLRIDLRPQKTTKHNNAPRLAELALSLTKTKRERHQVIENFFLTNDSTTIAIEVPVYIKPGELTKTEQKDYGITLEEPLSGHIDILQQRFTKIHILDYKPDAKISDKTSAEQLFLYALAINKRTGIPLRKITCAYFDDKNYFQLSLANTII